jgi:glucose/arabinose dehydrogenase
MRRPFAILAAAAVLTALPPIGDAPADAAVRRVAVMRCPGGGDCWPAAFAFTPNGDAIVYAERFSGEIRMRNLRTGADRLWHRIPDVATSGEQGILGIAVDPRWPDQRWVYAYYTERSPLRNRIVRIRKAGGETTVRGLLSFGANTYHNGGVIHFGPDGKLYAVTGDLGDLSLSQRRRHPAGKVLRLTRTGARPADNPFPDSKAFSRGHRNSFGFAFDPETGRLWQTENGPECEDEVNLVLAGRNYGWGPGSDCPGTSTAGPNPVQPKVAYTPVIAPTGAAFCGGCRLGAGVEGALLVGAWNDGTIRRLVLNDTRRSVVRQRVLFTNPSGILAVEASPRGPIFFSDRQGIYRLRRT